MKKTFIIYLLCIMYMCSSCINEEYQEREYLNDVLAEYPQLTKYSWLIIIPGAGCNGCIQESEYFLKKYVSEESLCFVLTNISSIKILQQKTSVKIKEHPNIYVDRDNVFLLPTNNSIYPCIAEVRNGIVVSVEFQSPQTSALHNLEESLLRRSEESPRRN